MTTIDDEARPKAGSTPQRRSQGTRIPALGSFLRAGAVFILLGLMMIGFTIAQPAFINIGNGDSATGSLGAGGASGSSGSRSSEQPVSATARTSAARRLTMLTLAARLLARGHGLVVRLERCRELADQLVYAVLGRGMRG